MKHESQQVSQNESQPRVSEEMQYGLEYFWRRWGNNSKNVSIHLPDFTDPQWTKQRYPRGDGVFNGTRYPSWEVQGDIVAVPYYEVKPPRQNRISALKDLLYSASIGNYGVIIDVGCGESLTPLTVAAEHTGSIVIALDPYESPLPVYPGLHRRSSTYTDEFPYTAKLLSEKNMSNNAAFFFPLNVHDKEVQQTLLECAWRVQLIAPDPEDEQGQSLLDLVLSSTKLVGPGGELILTGDGFLSTAFTLNMRLDPNSYTMYSNEGRALRQQLQELHDAYMSFATHEYTGYDLCVLYGIGDSGWFNTSESLYEDGRLSQDGYRTQPGVAIFSGKK